MKTSVLQSIINNFSKQITDVEEEIRQHNVTIDMYKREGSGKVYYNWRYKEIEKLRGKLKNLVGIQKQLKQDIAENVSEARCQRDFADTDSDFAQ